VGVNAEAASPSADDSATASTERAFMVGGLAFLIGIPVLFAGIWTLVWLVWRRR
jgi:flagellar biogenesis protein FliO